MDLVCKLGSRPNKTGPNRAAWGVFHCTFCGLDVEKVLSAGKAAMSCGCAHRKNNGLARVKHGLASHPLYKIWSGIKRRCEDPSREEYKNYGGRGISVCAEWKDAPDVFIAWALEAGWRRGLHIDREKGDLDYSPSNCRVVTLLVNNRNRRGIKLDVGKAAVIKKLCNDGLLTQNAIGEKFGVSQATVTDINCGKIWNDGEVAGGK